MIMAMKQLSSDKRSVRISRRAEAEKLDGLRVRFLRIYPDLPLSERASPCIVIDVNGKREPLSWHVCYMEIKYNTHLSKKILHWLGEMEFI
jgi:hypothetical protein